MKEMEIKINAKVYDNASELNEIDKKLLEKAIDARAKAYAPYSKFLVGCAILLENDVIVTGNNQENAAYPSGMCAERVAIWKVGSEHPNVKIKKILITATSEITVVDSPIGPCGACRQTLSEYEINQDEPIEIIFTGAKGKVVVTDSLLSLLPFSFSSKYL